MIRIGIIGQDPYAAHLMDALRSQPDVDVIGLYSHKPTSISKDLSDVTNLFCSESGLEYFKERGIKVKGFLEDFLEGIDFLMEYDPNELSIKLTFEGTGIQLSPKDIILSRLSSIPLSKLRIRWTSDIYCCPFFRPAMLELELSERVSLETLRDHLISSRRVSSINREVDLNEVCIYYPFFRRYTLFSIILFLRSIEPSKDGSSINIFSLYGILSAVPEAIDAIREMRGIDKEVSSSITDHHLNMKSGLLA
jgi:hypothetical protein